ncbi:hypothetical protein VFMJ11_A0644 [Aliivibrio fischeri MJ11]|uniref:Uncharacterized protein n=1 Tax=Aliivibrio fischeri (strain MJ11) TaxID=388396 RepID=B5EU25_ALIFM|nr:hypothetical protein VFMJ11_A0644 [Aliivibrio fischeri MJ11]
MAATPEIQLYDHISITNLNSAPFDTLGSKKELIAYANDATEKLKKRLIENDS